MNSMINCGVKSLVEKCWKRWTKRQQAWLSLMWEFTFHYCKSPFANSLLGTSPHPREEETYFLLSKKYFNTGMSHKFSILYRDNLVHVGHSSTKILYGTSHHQPSVEKIHALTRMYKAL